MALLAELFGDGRSKIVNQIFQCLCRKRFREQQLSTQSDDSFTIATNPLHAVDKSDDQQDKIAELELQAIEKDKQNRLLLERLKKEKKGKGRASHAVGSTYMKQSKMKRKTQNKKKQFSQMTAGMGIHDEL